jgi:hypothetical protein
MERIQQTSTPNSKEIPQADATLSPQADRLKFARSKSMLDIHVTEIGEEPSIVDVQRSA